MSEKGFFTLMGICFLLVAAIFVKGVQESEKNYSYVTRNFKDEIELQHIADSALIEAINLVKNNPELVPEPPAEHNVARTQKQHAIPLSERYDADVVVYAEYGIDTLNNIGNIYFLERKYVSGGEYKDNFLTDADGNDLSKKGVILISVASRDSNLIEGKIYRRSLAYILTDGDEDGKIYFMNSLNNN